MCGFSSESPSVKNFIFLISLGATLDKAGATVTWHINDNGEDQDQDQEHQGYKLYIKQILLGHTAKEGEYNVVEVCYLFCSDIFYRKYLPIGWLTLNYKMKLFFFVCV